MTQAACKAGTGRPGAGDEQGWLARHCAGDAAAFPALLARYRQPLYSYLARCGLDPASRDDLFQDIFLKIHAAAGSFQPERSLRAWVFTIAANTVRNHWRASRNRFAVVDPAGQAAPEPDAEDRAQTAETLDWLAQAIAALPIAQREVLVLVSVQGMAQRDVAAILDMPLNSVKTNLRRARLALLQELRRRDTPAAAGETP